MVILQKIVETLELLMTKHFPGCKDKDNFKQRKATSNNVSELIVSMINEEKVSWAVSSFDPYKSAGPDGIFPALIQDLYQSSYQGWLLFLGVVFIPKAGKINHNTAKYYRPTSLTSFLLKTLERLIDVYVHSHSAKLLSGTTRLPKR